MRKLLALAATLVLALSWIYLVRPALRARSVRDRLAALPSFTHQNEASVRTFREADARARENPLEPEAVGRLGMLYHAYQFLDEARRCYELARELAAEEFRWIYYQAMLEKKAFRYEESEALFQRALELRPDDAELHAELGDLYLMWSRPNAAAASLTRALKLDPLQPVAALGKARLAVISQRWERVIELLRPLLARYPRLSRAHAYLAAAYGALGDEAKRAHHQELSEYGSAVESDRMKALHELAVDAIVGGGDPQRGPELLRVKCARCHTHDRIYDHDENRRWWARTVRRMQREAGWQWLTDDEAASVVAYLAGR